MAVWYKRKLELQAQAVVEYKRTALNGMKRALQKMEESDSFQAFGNFVATELRKIPNQTAANNIQRKVQRKLLDCIEDYEMCSKSSINASSQTEEYDLIEYDPDVSCDVSYYDEI